MSRLLILALLISSPALAAAPKTGDTATYDVTTTQVPDQTGKLTWTVGALDPAADTAVLTQSLTFMGRTQTSQLTTQYRTLAVVDQVVASCAQFGGTPEALDVPAGHFNTCRLHEEDDKAVKTAWFASVPVLGFAKFTQTTKNDNVTMTFFLRSSTH